MCRLVKNEPVLQTKFIGIVGGAAAGDGLSGDAKAQGSGKVSGVAFPDEEIDAVYTFRHFLEAAWHGEEFQKAVKVVAPHGALAMGKQLPAGEVEDSPSTRAQHPESFGEVVAEDAEFFDVLEDDKRVNDIDRGLVDGQFASAAPMEFEILNTAIVQKGGYAFVLIMNIDANHTSETARGGGEKASAAVADFERGEVFGMADTAGEMGAHVNMEIPCAPHKGGLGVTGFVEPGEQFVRRGGGGAIDFLAEAEEVSACFDIPADCHWGRSQTVGRLSATSNIDFR